MNTYAAVRNNVRALFAQRLTLRAQALVLFAVVGVALYVVFFTTTPAIHDFFHELRHSMGVIPCH